MTTLRRALGNSAIMLAAQGITWATTIVLTGFLGRTLGVTRFGDLYLAISFGMAFGVLVEFGLDQQLIRAVARDRDLADRYLVNSVAIKAGIWVLAYLLTLIAVRLLRYPPELRLTIEVYSVILLFNGCSNALAGLFKARETVVYPALGTIIEKAADCAIAVALLTHGFGVVAMAAVYVVGSATNVAWQVIWLLRGGRPRAAIDRHTIAMLMKGALPFLLYWMLGSLYFRLDVVLLSKLTDSDTVGWYGAAYRLFDTLVFLPNIVAATILYPILSRLSLGARADLRLAIGKGLDILLVAGVPICTGLIVLAEPLIRLLYGESDFLRAAPALRWLAVGLLALYVNSVLGIVFFSLNQEKKMTILAGLAAVFNLGLNLLLIPHFRHVGAAVVTSGTECFVLAYLLAFVPKDLLARSTLAVLAKAALAAAAMALVLYGLRGQSVLLLVPAGAAVYGASGLLLRLVPPEDLRALKVAILARRGRAPAPQEAV